MEKVSVTPTSRNAVIFGNGQQETDFIVGQANKKRCKQTAKIVATTSNGWSGSL